MQSGWGDLDNPVETNIEPTEKDRLIFEVFSTAKGKRLLKLLGEIEQEPNLPLGCNDGVLMGQLMAFKEGEKNFYRKLVQSINKVTKKGN